MIKTYKFADSPNCWKGWIRAPLGVIIHWTAGTFEGSLNWLCDKHSKASAHFIVRNTGEIVQLVSLNDRAWHAGKSKTKFGKSCNQYTFGVELEGPPSYLNDKLNLDLESWPEDQLIAAINVVKHINKHTKLKFMTDHSTISPGRKPDVKTGTGIDLFPWFRFVECCGIADIESI